MGWKLQMQPGEIASLTWGRWISTRTHPPAGPDGLHGSRLRRCCWTLGTAQGPREPRSYRTHHRAAHGPLRLTTVTRTALIRGGLEHVNLRNLHTWVRQGSGPAFDGSGEEQAGYP